MTEKNIRTAKRWAFPIAVAAFVILQIIINDNCLATIWALTAAAFHLIACFFEEAFDDQLQANRDLVKTVDEIITANHDLAKTLGQKDAEISQLQNEIETLKNKLRA